jgi:ABC-type nitrate/sulfonate/bicarbonate transport system permease component
MSFQDAWVPNGRVSKRVHRILGAGTVALLLAAWALRPAFLPGPADVVRAYPRLMDQGLAQQLFVSLTTNFQAIALSCLFTIPLAYLTVLPVARPFVRSLSKMRFLGLTGLTVLFTLTFGGGHALKVAPRALELPWHRVVGAGGRIAFAAGSANFREQRRRLRAEGVEVERGRVRLPPAPDLDALLWGRAR